VGLYILPHRRKRAKAELKTKVEALRSQVMGSLRQHFASEAGRSQGRIRNAIAPYTRFVRSEREHLEVRRGVFSALRGKLADLDHQLQAITADPDHSEPA
jgi:hypothetical protein